MSKIGTQTPGKNERTPLLVERHFRDLTEQISVRSDLNAFVHLMTDDGLKAARDIDRRLAEGDKVGALAGKVFAIKDNINIKGRPSSCASKILQPFVSPYDATVIKRLRKADALFIGKTNMDEFAMGSSNENSAFGPVLNPWDKEKVPGGSSGGSAVAVASRCADVALGSDTGGSVRQPASFTGVYGLKPTYGRISRYGLIAFGSSLDQIGILANSPLDIAQTLNIIAGNDPADSTSATTPIPDYTRILNDEIKGIKIGIPGNYFGAGLDPVIKTRIMELIKDLEKAGAEIVDISLPMTDYAIAMYYIIATAEASSNLARFDGVRFGMREKESKTLNDMYGQTRSAGFGEEVQRRIILGTYVLSAGYYDAYYKKALQVRRLLKQNFEQAYKKCDVILSPTTPSTAFKLNEKTSDPLSMYLSDVYTVSANLTGNCAISVPVGTDKDGMPIGAQLQANDFDEDLLLKLSQFIHNNIHF